MGTNYTVYAIPTDHLGMDVTDQDVARMDALLEHEIAAAALRWRARVLVSDAPGYSAVPDHDSALRAAIDRAFDRLIIEGIEATTP